MNAPVLRRARSTIKAFIEDRFLAMWDGVDESAPATWRRVADEELCLEAEHLAAFWTSRRVAIGDATEAYLAQNSENW